jgi:hypothetical protein
MGLGFVLPSPIAIPLATRRSRLSAIRFCGRLGGGAEHLQQVLRDRLLQDLVAEFAQRLVEVGIGHRPNGGARTLHWQAQKSILFSRLVQAVTRESSLQPVTT